MISLGVTSNLDQLEAAFQKMAAGQVPFATSLTINRVAEFAKSALQVEMNRVFDRPKPFTINSIFIKRSTKTNLTATVFHSDRVAPYLLPEIAGGVRDEKQFEIILGNDVLVPTQNAPRDAYGGVPRAFIRKVLSQALPIGRPALKAEYVLVRPGVKSKLLPGIYQRVGGKIHALFYFKTAAHYEKRYDMLGVVERTIAAEFDRQFAANMDFALGTARLTLKA